MANAGTVNVVLTTNAVTFTQGIKQAQAQLDQFAGKAKSAGHGSASSMQAVSASLRAMHGGFENNIRAVERWIATSKTAATVAKAIFPIVGAATFGVMIYDLGNRVAEFVQKVNAMPAAITRGFAELNLSATSSADAINLTNIELQNSISKLEGKPQNNLALAMAEAKVASDKFAESIQNSNNKLEQLLSANHISAFAILMGKQGTADREGTVKYFAQQQDDAGLRYQQAIHDGDQKAAAQAQQDLRNSQNAELKNVLRDRDNQKIAAAHGAGNSDANIAIDTGVATNILAQQNEQAGLLENGQLKAKEKQAQTASDARKKAAEASKKAAEEFRKNLDQDLANWNAAQRLTQDMAKATTEHNQEFYKSNGLSTDDQKNLSDQGKGANAYLQSLRTSIDLNKQQADAIAEASLKMAIATGQMTKLDAAQVAANMHTADYNRALQDLRDQREAIASDPQYNGNELARKAALQDNSNRISGLNGNRTIQAAEDRQATNPSGTSALVGATDALDEFVIASRDAAATMRSLVSNTLSGLNQQIVAAMSGQRTSFGNFGAGVFRNVASAGLNKVEGTALGALGFGGRPDGTQGKPLYVRLANDVSGAASSASGFLGRLFGSGAKGPGQSGLNSALSIASSASAADSAAGGIGTIASDFAGMIPFLAAGGPINGPAIVGENGPELFNPGTSGTIIPNHKLIAGSSGTTINVDATGASDPAQIHAAVARGITEAAPHLMAGAVQFNRDTQRRTPSVNR